MSPFMSPLLMLLLVSVVQTSSHPSTTPTYATSFSLLGQFVLNDGAPNQAVVDLPMVSDGLAVAPFESLTAPVSIGNGRDSIRLRWKLDNASAATSPIPYAMTAFSGDTSVLALPSVSVPLAGVLPVAASTFSYADFTMNFTCKAEGTAVVGLTVRLTDTTKSLPYPVIQTGVFLQKDCLPPSCAGKCVRGTCSGTQCVCDSAYRWSTYCDLGWWASQTDVCPGSDFTINWDFLNDTRSNLVDQFRIYRPDPATPFASWTVSSMNTAIFAQTASAYAQVDLKDLGNPQAGQFTYAIQEEVVGMFALVLMQDSQATATAVLSLNVLSKTDSRCVPATNDCQCSGHGFCSAQWSCTCDPGYFGTYCQHGCAANAVTYRTAFGGAVSSSASDQPYFLNNANCTWFLTPSASFPAATSIALTIETIQTEPVFDKLVVYSGLGLNSANRIATYSGSSQNQIVVINSNSATLSFVTDSSFPSWPGISKGFNLTYYALGCPAGSFIQSANSGSGVTYSCDLCPAGRFSASADAESCILCARGKFSASAGSVQCSDCAPGSSTNLLSGSTACSACTPGTFAKTPGEIECSLCAAGTYSDTSAATTCASCEVEAYAAQEGSSFCLACPSNTAAPYQRATALSECICKAGYFTFGNSSGVPCIPCPPGATCSGGSAAPQADANNWFDVAGPTRMLQCYIQDVCVGGGPNSCVEGHEGKLCSRCSGGYSANSIGLCEPCTGGASAKLPLFMTALLVLSVFLLLVFTRRKEDDIFLKAMLDDRELLRRHKMPGFATSCAIMFTYVQIMGTFGRYTNTWPGAVSSLWSAFNVANLDLSILSVQCSVPLDYETLYKLRIFMPFLILITFAFLWLLSHVQHFVARHLEGPLKRRFPETQALVEMHKAWSLRAAAGRLQYQSVERATHPAYAEQPKTGEERMDEAMEARAAVDESDDSESELSSDGSEDNGPPVSKLDKNSMTVMEMAVMKRHKESPKVEMKSSDNSNGSSVGVDISSARSSVSRSRTTVKQPSRHANRLLRALTQHGPAGKSQLTVDPPSPVSPISPVLSWTPQHSPLPRPKDDDVLLESPFAGAAASSSTPTTPTDTTAKPSPHGRPSIVIPGSVRRTSVVLAPISDHERYALKALLKSPLNNAAGHASQTKPEKRRVSFTGNELQRSKAYEADPEEELWSAESQDQPPKSPKEQSVYTFGTGDRGVRVPNGTATHTLGVRQDDEADSGVDREITFRNSGRGFTFRAVRNMQPEAVRSHLKNEVSMIRKAALHKKKKRMEASVITPMEVDFDGFAEDLEESTPLWDPLDDPEPDIGTPLRLLWQLATVPLVVEPEACSVALLFFMNSFYIYLVSSAVELWDCFSQYDGTSTLLPAPHIDCYSSEWNALLPYGIFAMMFYGIGVPVWQGYVLYRTREMGDLYDKTFTFIHNFPYHVPFRESVSAWAQLVLLRKLLISVAVVSVTKDEGGKLLTAFLVMFASMYLQARHQPYKLVVHNTLEFRMSVIAMVVLVCSLVFVNDTLQPVLLRITTVMCMIALCAAFILGASQAFLFLYPRYLRFKWHMNRGHDWLGAVREAMLAA